MIPKSLYVVKSNKGLLGHQWVQKSNKQCIFGFVKHQDALQVADYVKNTRFYVHKVNDACFTIKKRGKNKRAENIVVAERNPHDIVIEASLNNLKMEVIDELQTDGEVLIMSANYDMNINIDDIDIVKERLEALFENRQFTVDDIVIDE